MNTNTTMVKFIQRIPVLHQFISKFSSDVTSFGPVAAAQQLIQRYHGKLIIHMPPETAKVLKSSGSIVAFNHPYEIETYIVQACVPNRRDLIMIATANILSVAPDLKPYLIPVWVDHTAKKEKRGKLSGKIAKIFSLRQDLNPNEAHLNNIQSITKAANHVSGGGVIFIAPEGFRGKGGRWFFGIGHLISQVEQKNDSYYISCFISGTSNLDWLRLIPLINRLYPPIHVYFSQPQKLMDIIVKNDHPKKIALGLETQYRLWSKTLAR
jgi:hypothetical protein